MLFIIIIAYNKSTNNVLHSLSGKQIKSVKDFKCLWSYIASFKNNIFIRISKTWADYNKFDRIWKLEAILNLVSSILLLNTFLSVAQPLELCHHQWTKRLNGCYTRMLQTALIIFWHQHLSNKELYGKILAILKTIQKYRLKFVGHCC